MKLAILLAMSVMTSALLHADTAPTKTPKTTNQTPTGPDFNAGPDADKDVVLQSFTEGDQTDIYAIPFDDDQLGQEEEFEMLENEGKKDKQKKDPSAKTAAKTKIKQTSKKSVK